MNALLFLLLCTLYSGLFWAIYRYSVRQNKAWKLRRSLCLSLPALALALAVLPALLPTSVARPFHLPVLTAVSLTAAPSPAEATSTPFYAGHYSQWLWLLMLLGTACFTVVSTWRYLRLRWRIQQLPEVWRHGQRVRLTEKPGQAYQFGTFIVVSRAYLDQEESLAIILRHEAHHLTAGHHRERMAALMLQHLGWWNPFSWLWCRALRSVHEYEADARVTRQFRPAAYTQLLLSQKLQLPQWPRSSLQAGGLFFSVTLKKRVDMMHQKHSVAGYRLVWLVPAFLLMLGLSWSCSQKTAESAPEQTPVGFSKVTQTPRTEACADQSGPAAMRCFNQAIMQRFQENFQYPKQLMESDESGRIYVSFVIGSDGAVQDARIRRSLPLSEGADPALADLADAAVLRAVEDIPPFAYPAEKDGQPVPMRFTLPILLQPTSPKEAASS